MKTVYKAVKKRDGRLVSLIVQGKARMVYEPREVAKPPFGKVFAFDMAYKAIEFAEDTYGAEVWRAEATEVGEIEWMAQYTDDEVFEAFWKGEDYGWRGKPPEGTVGCGTVRLIECVWRESGV